MPYVFIESLEEGQEAADVVERAEFDSVNQKLNEALDQRDQAIERAVSAEKGYSEMRQKYADTFLSKSYAPSFAPKPAEVSAQSISDLFKESE